MSSAMPPRIIQNLGKKHKGYNVVPAHYDVVGQALLDTLKLGLGDLWTKDVAKAWTEIYGVVSSTMIAGAEY